MKQKRKLLSLVMAVSMMATMSATAFASEESDFETSESQIYTQIVQNDVPPTTNVDDYGIDPYAPSLYNYTSYWGTVSNVNVAPNNGIVKIIAWYASEVGNNTLTAANGRHATGFIVGDGKILTSGHVIQNNYDNSTLGNQEKAMKVAVYFEHYDSYGTGNYSSACFATSYSAPTEWAYSSQSGNSTQQYNAFHSDYGVINVPTSYTNGKNQFSLATPTSSILANTNLTINGYPYGYGFNGLSMRTDSDNGSYYMDFGIKHDINISSGVSGAPLFNISNNVVYGIQSKGWSNLINSSNYNPNNIEYNYGGYAVPINQSIINFVKYN